MKSALLTLALVLTLSSASQANSAKLLSCLRNIKSDNSQANLVTPESLAYETDRLVYDRNFNYFPRAIYHAATEAEAAAAIQCAAANNISVAPRSGGHSYEGYGSGGADGSLVIDLNLFQHFRLDPETAVVTVGAGTRLGPLYTKLWALGQYLIPAGTCAGVGIGGHALGGGLGMISRKYGMLTDNIVGMKMIDATGQILQVNATSNADLFWALRGAGSGSFGLVTEFKIHAYKAPAIVTRMLLHWPLSRTRQLVRAYGMWGEDHLSEDMFVAMRFEHNIELQVNFLGSQAEAEEVLRPLIQAAGQPDDIVAHEGTWIEAAALWNVVPDPSGLAYPDLTLHRNHRGRSLLYRRPLSDDEMEVIERYMTARPEGSSKIFVILDIWGGKIDRPNSPAAFDHHRGVFHSINLSIEWPDKQTGGGETPTSCIDCLKWSTDFTHELQKLHGAGHEEVEAYQNYIERDLRNGLRAYYGDLLPRLQQIKQKVDPGNVFSFPQSIPLPELVDRKVWFSTQ
ncbi:hypothetical protein BGW41_003148 [Actinomortierella wolfii]|nr:hypothetical protein BGW41_003148 [Actinomortierella wolfii]